MGSIIQERTMAMIETNLKKVYEEIGKKYYEDNKDNLNNDSYQQYFREIEKIESEKEKIESRKLMLQGRRKCQYCQAIVPIESKFCNMCGEKMPEIKVPEKEIEGSDIRKCMNCGNTLETDAMFCPNCGRKC